MFIKDISCHFHLVSNSMDPDQDRHFVKTVHGGVQRSSLFSIKRLDPDQDQYFDKTGRGPNCLKGVSIIPIRL